MADFFGERGKSSLIMVKMRTYLGTATNYKGQ
jgi:hypothetical protein